MPDQPDGIITRMSCPFCDSRKGTCCRCGGTGSIPYDPAACSWAWERKGCPCDACGRLRRQRHTIWEYTEPGRVAEREGLKATA